MLGWNTFKSKLFNKNITTYNGWVDFEIKRLSNCLIIIVW